MNWKTTTVLAVLAGLLFWYYRDQQAGGGKAESDGETGPVVDTAAADVVKAEFASGTAKLVLEKKGESWEITAPEALKADEGEVSNLLGQLVPLYARRRVREEDAAKIDRKTLGLVPPQGTITINAKENKTHVFRVGGPSPVKEDEVYLEVEGKHGLFLAGDAYAKALAKTPADLRDRTIVAWDDEKLAKVSLTIGSETAELAKGADGWSLTKPVAEPADGTAVDGLLSGLKQLKALAFRTEKEVDLKAAGLDAPSRRVVISEKDASGTKEFSLGKPVPSDATRRYARRGDGAIVEIPEEAASKYPKALADLRKRDLFDFPAADVLQVKIEGPAFQLAVERKSADGAEASTWSAVLPSGMSVDPSQVTTLLDQVTQARAVEFFETVPADPKTYGLDRPIHLTFTVRDRKAEEAAAQEEEKKKAAAAAAKPEDKKDEKKDEPKPTAPKTYEKAYLVGVRHGLTYTYVQVAGRTQVIGFPPELAQELSRGTSLFRSLQALAIDPSRVSAVAWTLGDRKARIEKGTDGKWSLKEPAGAEPDEAKIDAFLAALNPLGVRKFLAGDPDERRKYRLDTPDLKVIITHRTGAAPKPGDPGPAAPEKSENAAVHLSHDLESDNTVGALGDGTVFLLDRSQARTLLGGFLKGPAGPASDEHPN